MIYSIFDITDLFGNTENMYNSLPKAERELTDIIKDEKDKDRHICSLALLSVLFNLKEYKERDSGEIISEKVTEIEMKPMPEIFRNKSGKPCFQNGKPNFSISHSKNAVMVAISESAVGVDIEMRREDMETDRINRRFFGEENRDFFRLWTEKEALAKMTGEGLAKALKAVVDYEKIKILHGEFVDKEGNKYEFCVAKER